MYSGQYTNYMNYGQQTGANVQNNPIPSQPVPPGIISAHYPYGPEAYGKYPPLFAPMQRIGCNKNYLRSPLSLFRFLLIPALIATIVSIALVRNRSLKNRRQSSYDTSVWIPLLVFACVGLLFTVLSFLMNLCNIPNVRLCRIIPWTILFALLDLMWFPAMIILGAFAARREHVNDLQGNDLRRNSINRGAFGAASAFALLSGILFLASAITGFLKRRAPLRRLPY